MIIDLALGVMLSTYSDSRTDVIYKAEIGYKNAYLWGGYEEPDIRFDGNLVANTHQNSFGIGFRHEIQKFTLYIEAGYTMIDKKLAGDSTHEMVYTELVKNHYVEGRRVPVSCKDNYCGGSNKGDYNSSYDIDDAWVGRIGVRYEVMPHVEVSASYKAMKADQEYAIWDDDSNYPVAGYWREDKPFDFSSFEVGFLVRY